MPLKKNDYRSIIDITFMSGVAFYMVAISTSKKIMAEVENKLNDDDFFGDIVDTPKEGLCR